MADLTIPNTLTNGAVADADEVMANFDAVETYVNTEVIRRDASIDFTALPSAPTGTTPVGGELVTKAKYDSMFPGLLTTNNVTFLAASRKFSDSIECTSTSWQDMGATGEYSLSAFDWPTLGTTRMVEVEFYVPEFRLTEQGGGYIPAGDMLEMGIFMKQGSGAWVLQNIGKVAVPTYGALADDQIPSLMVKRTYWSGDTFMPAAGTSVTFKIQARIGHYTSTDGGFVWQGTSNAPILFTAKLV